jgi:hypothetical protein
MFILDSLMIAGIRWVLDTAVTAAEAEMNDDTALREQLLEAEMRREMGEISDAEFEDTEADLLTRIREIKERRQGGDPLPVGGAPSLATSAGSTFQVDASIVGDFYEERSDRTDRSERPGGSTHSDRLSRSKKVKAGAGRSAHSGDAETGKGAKPAIATDGTRRTAPATRVFGTTPTPRTPPAPRSSRTRRTARAIRTTRTKC